MAGIPTKKPEAIGVRDAARIVGVHHITVRRWIRNGWIKAYRVGPMLIRIPVTEIRRMRALRLQALDLAKRPRYPQV